MREELEKKWLELKTPINERVETLVHLLDASKATPEMLILFENLQTKLTDRIPIAQVFFFFLIIICYF
jgi:hypothetical protein